MTLACVLEAEDIYFGRENPMDDSSHQHQQDEQLYFTFGGAVGVAARSMVLQTTYNGFTNSALQIGTSFHAYTYIALTWALRIVHS